MELQVLYYLFMPFLVKMRCFHKSCYMVRMPVLGGIIIIIYAYLTFKSTGSIKTDSFLILIGIIFFSVGQMAHTSTAIKILGSILPVLAAIGMLIGMITIALTFRKIAISS